MPDPVLVGIVVVSHSRALAEAAVELAREMIHGRDLRVAVAAGLDDGTTGTDATRIAAAVGDVDSGAGVVVLMDLGSAVLSAELALELLADPAAADRVLLCPAPVVEGLVAAVVAAAGGADRAEVAAEAEAALDGKRSQLGYAPARPADPAATRSAAETPAADRPDTVTGRFRIDLPHGLHARPAARLVEAARASPATLTVRNLTTGAGPVSAVSLSGLATLGATRGHELEVAATGEGAQAAVDVVLALAARDFDEIGDTRPATEPSRTTLPSSTPEPASTTPRTSTRGAAPGIAVGPVRHLREAAADPVVASQGTPDEEADGLTAALDAVRDRLCDLRSRAVDAAAADIFGAHLLMLDDPALVDPAARGISDGQPAATAWAAAVATAERKLAGLADDYLRARAADVRAVGDQVLHALTGRQPAVLSGAGVLVARDLTPAQTAELDLGRVHGLVLAAGSPTSHAAILARARGLPALVGAGTDVLDIAEGTQVVLDGGSGVLLVDPEPKVLADYRGRAKALAVRHGADLAAAGGRARTRDGADVVVAANVGSLAESRAARDAGADAAGLVRTEFLFLGREQAPDVDEQVAEYLALADAMDGRRLTFRTLDVGGDKPVPYVPMPPEDNPFLGVRGLRLTLARPELLRDQLVALCRVARRTPVSIMFPMVSTLDELLRARAALDAAAPGGLPSGLEVGIMVEVPAAALKAAVFLPHVDFLSIGTNDLTQYAMAADRGNDAMAALGDPLDPGVLTLIAKVCAAAGDAVPVAVCGEAAADPVAVPVLLGLGVRELSVAPPAVPTTKATVRTLDLAACTRLAGEACKMASAQQVRAAASRPTG